jgi:hypothetical protein
VSAPTDTEWLEADVIILRKLWDADGLSASEIGVILKRSKNAVISKVHRLELAARKEAPKRAARIAQRNAHVFKPKSAVPLPAAFEDTRSITGKLMGDPPRGRSALDKRNFAPVDNPVYLSRVVDLASRPVHMEDHHVSRRVV